MYDWCLQASKFCNKNLSSSCHFYEVLRESTNSSSLLELRFFPVPRFSHVRTRT